MCGGASPPVLMYEADETFERDLHRLVIAELRGILTYIGLDYRVRSSLRLSFPHLNVSNLRKADYVDRIVKGFKFLAR